MCLLIINNIWVEYLLYCSILLCIILYTIYTIKEDFMLTDLSIKDFAIITDENLEFENGFTVLTGETGAGKSILIGAITFLLGGATNATQIRAGSNMAEVNATFDVKNVPQAFNWLSEHGIDDNGGTIIMRRYIRMTGKSASWINGTSVTKKDIEEFASFLIDIHGQHEHQSLLKVSEHRVALDERAGLTKKVLEFSKLYETLLAKKRELSNMSTNELQREHDIDLYNYAIDEIESAKLQPNEDVELEAEETKLSSFEKLYADIESAKGLLDTDGNGVLSMLKKAMNTVERALEFDEGLKDISQRLESVYYDASDVVSDISSYFDKLFFDPQRLKVVEDRLSLIYDLKKKYVNVNSPLSAVTDYLLQIKEKLNKITHASENKEALEAQIATLEKQVMNEATTISKKRCETAAILSTEVEGILQTLGMKGAKFLVSITQKSGDTIEKRCSSYGIDNVEFLIAPNKGMSALPLSKIASGGEISRVMLALKTVFAENLCGQSPETLIFDEIDTGIGGTVALAIGEHIKKLSQKKQIFCITHQASIACYANHQAKIQKSDENGATVSNVHYVTGDERVSEIARMLSGDEKSKESLDHARAMLQKAQE